MHSSDHDKASTRDVSRRFFRVFTPQVRMDVDEWADVHRELSKIANKRGGKWKSRCYQRKPQQRMTNPAVRSMCIVGAAQTFGKSELILNFTGRQIHLNPGPMMIVQPTDGMARRFSRKRLQPMLTDTPPLREIVATAKSRSASNTVSAKEFPGGEIRVVGADTPTALCSDPERDVMIDEVDRCQKSCGREGDVVTLAEARQEDFGEDAFSLFTSTPSGIQPRPIGQDQPEGVSKIMLLFEESDKQFWFCPCQKCGRKQTLKWSQVIWPEHRPEDARYVCEFGDCLWPHNDAERIAMIEAGEWIATAPFDGREGYFLNGIYSLSKPQRGCVSKLHQMARDFLRAKRRGVEALRAWINTFLCECAPDDTAETIEPMPLYQRREAFGHELHPRACVITAGVDPHPLQLHVQIVAWGDGEESWPLEFHVILGDVEKPEVWKELDELLLRKFDHPCGAQLGIERVCVDSGNKPDETYTFCRPRQLRGVYAIKGIKGFGLPVMNLPKKSGVRKIRLWLVAKNTALKAIHARLAQTEPGPGYIHFRNDNETQFGPDYFTGLTANHVVIVKRAGVEHQDFDPAKRPDEPMDTFVYALAALRKVEPTDFKRILQRMIDAQEAKRNEAASPQKEAAQVVRPHSRGGFGTGWTV